jgi:hypothetical protein
MDKYKICTYRCDEYMEVMQHLTRKEDISQEKRLVTLTIQMEANYWGNHSAQCNDGLH